MAFIGTTLKNGYMYSKDWPCMNELNAVFVENKVIKATQFAKKVCPAIALCGAWVQYSYLGASQLPLIFTLMLAILAMPLQGFYWLGKRAELPLSPALLTWYGQVKQKMQESGVTPAPLEGKPCYRDLAKLLKQAVAQLDKTFIREWL